MAENADDDLAQKLTQIVEATKEFADAQKAIEEFFRECMAADEATLQAEMENACLVFTATAVKAGSRADLTDYIKSVEASGKLSAKVMFEDVPINLGRIRAMIFAKKLHSAQHRAMLFLMAELAFGDQDGRTQRAEYAIAAHLCKLAEGVERYFRELCAS